MTLALTEAKTNPPIDRVSDDSYRHLKLDHGLPQVQPTHKPTTSARTEAKIKPTEAKKKLRIKRKSFEVNI